MKTKVEDLDKQIDEARNKIRTDKLDITYGELASLYENGELTISPDYQRLFRWEIGQKTKLVESLLLGIPIPAIFVAEDESGKWELVDGLQRISTVLEFMGHLRDPDKPNLRREPTRLAALGTRLRSAMILPGLDGMTFDELSLRSRLSIKRASCRVEVIKVGSRSSMKYEVFERLNTGGSHLTEQELRNCIFRAVAPQFMAWVDEMAKFPPFADNLGLSEFQEQSLYDRGLVLRFLTMTSAFEQFEHDVEPYITEHVRQIVDGKVDFDQRQAEAVFKETFSILSRALGEDAFRHYREGKHRGQFSVYVFDVLSVGVSRNLEKVKGYSAAEVKKRCIAIKCDPTFVRNTGAGGNSRPRAEARISVAIRLMSQPASRSQPPKPRNKGA